MASRALNSAELETERRSAEFPTTVWGNYFTSLDSKDLKMDEKVEEEVHTLKQEVKNMLIAPSQTQSQKLCLIDSIQRLGVADHFQSEIQDLLDQLNNAYVDSITDTNDHNLYLDALLFRLLRQQGYRVSSDIFKKYLDHEGKFKESLAKDVHGLLSLYEGSYFAVHGEDILDQALNFATKKLEDTMCHLSYPLSEEVSFALKHPLRRGMPRLEARHFISIYEQDSSHSKALLRFAKLDYNIIQKLHQKELGEVSRWWKDMDFTTMAPSSTRDRIAESYLWALITIPERQYSHCRRFVAKVIQMVTIMDDIFDVHGTPEELKLLIDAIERWDISTQCRLPDYLKYFYEKLLLFFADFEKDKEIDTESILRIHSRNQMKELAKAYYGESSWLKAEYIPTIDEYCEIAMTSIGFCLVSVIHYTCMGDAIPKEAFDWILTKPKILRGAQIIGRLMNDMVSHKFEQDREHVASAVECYIKQYEVSEEEACTALRKRVDNAWKDINECCLKPTEFSMVVLSVVANLARTSHVFYRDEDGYTFGDGTTKLYITTLIVEPVPL